MAVESQGEPRVLPVCVPLATKPRTLFCGLFLGRQACGTWSAAVRVMDLKGAVAMLTTVVANVTRNRVGGCQTGSLLVLEGGPFDPFTLPQNVPCFPTVPERGASPASVVLEATSLSSAAGWWHAMFLEHLVPRGLYRGDCCLC